MKYHHNNKFPWKTLIISFAAVLITAIIGFSIIYFFTYSINKTSNIIEKSINSLSSLFSEKNEISVRVANLIRDTKTSRLQFKKRNVLLLFQLIRWRDKDSGLELFDVKPGIINPDTKNVLLGQYTIAEANGNFEILFSIDLTNCNSWRYKWNDKTSTLNVLLPEFKLPFIKSSAPALTSPLDIFIKTDCTTFDENTTLKMLKIKIPILKQIAAERQIPYIREDARKALKEFFFNILSGLKKNKNIHFAVNVIFKDDNTNQPNFTDFHKM
jgi:hypothetical protein